MQQAKPMLTKEPNPPKNTAENVLNNTNASADTKVRAQNILYQANAILNDPNQIAQYANWKEGGIYRVALHTAIGGLLTGDISGAAAAGSIASAAPLLNDLQKSVTAQLTKAGASTLTASTISQALAELTSLGIGAAVSSATGGNASAGAGAALAVDTNNRQLHDAQIQRIKKLAANDPDKEKRLFIAGCVIEQCSAGFPVGSAEYIFYQALEQEGQKPEYQTEINQLKAEVTQ